MIDFNEVIKRIKQTRGLLSQKNFADKAEISASYLSSVENGRTKPSIDLLTSISLAFDVSLDWLIGGTSKSARGAIIKSKGINILENYGSVSQLPTHSTGENTGPLSEFFDRLGFLSIENDKLKIALDEYSSLKIDNNELKARNTKLEDTIRANGIECD